MAEDMQLCDRVDEIRAEVLFAIKERFKAIVGDDMFNPIALDGPVVIDNSVKVEGSWNHVCIQNIFLDENGILCADFYNKEDSLNCEIIFGKQIEGLFVEDLVQILQKLCEIGGEQPVAQVERHAASSGAKKSLQALKSILPRAILPSLNHWRQM